jgi:SAM-dependent methyltransferase
VPTIEENRRKWSQYAWPKGGEEWSRRWGGARREWFHTIFSRILPFLPAPSVLEIAVGRGRWTGFLLRRCERYHGVDIVESCVEHCRRRFAARPKAAFSMNDGRTLPMIADDSVDFAFSFDSLVHADCDAIGSYLRELSCKLIAGGYGFFHHSNLAACAGAAVPNPDWRDPGMSAALFAALCEEAGLTCIAQETVNWNQPEMIDCFSLFARLPEGHPQRRRGPTLRTNPRFDEERTNAGEMGRLYRRFRLNGPNRIG